MKKLLLSGLIILGSTLTMNALGWTTFSGTTFTEDYVQIGPSSGASTLTVGGVSSSPPTSGVNGTLAIYSDDIGLGFGCNSSSNYSWLQSIAKEGSTYYPLCLNPLGANVGIGTIAPTKDLSFGNDTARTIWIENTASGTAGKNLTVQSGSTGGGTNKDGGDLVLQAGAGTGTGSSTMYFKTATPTTSGTGAQTPSTKMSILGNGAVSIGGSASDLYSLRITRDITGPGSSTFRSAAVTAEIKSGVTNVRSFESAPNTHSTASVTTLHHFIATDVDMGAGGSVTTQNSFTAGDMGNATNNRGFLGQLTAAAGRYNCYMSGNAANYFQGAVTIIGAGWITAAWTISDKQFKTNIDSLQNALTIISKLKPKSYYFDTVKFNAPNKFDFSSKKQYGFIAQELETILPELVSSNIKPAVLDSLGNEIIPALTYKGVNYIEMIAILTKGIQELSNENDSLKTKTDKQDSLNTSLQNQMNQLITNDGSLQNQLSQLMEAMNNCCNTSTQSSIVAKSLSKSVTTQIDVTLNDAQSVVLEQNVPNPFAEQTTINYSLPDNTVKAQMLFYNSQGQLIQTVELIHKGKGALNVFAQDLTNGIYTYTLVVDSKIIETKKMIKQ